MDIIRNHDRLKEKVVFPREYPIHLSDTIGVTSQYQRLHAHDALEINMIKSGTGYYIINGVRYDFQPGDIALIGSGALHCAYETDGLVMQVMTFDAAWFMGNLRSDPDVLNPFKEMGVYFTPVLDRNHPQIPALRALLLDIQEEHEAARPSYVSVVYSYLLQFFVRVNRHFRQENVRQSKDTVSSAQLDKIRLVILAMEQRYAYPWTLEELAALAYLSPSRFSDVFRRAVGASPLMYLIQVRLENAYHLLETSDLKILDIAMECGFRTLSNFNRLFKRHIGTEPRHIRSRANCRCSKMVPVYEHFVGESGENGK
ncbi:AraC family transcriptional regulator [Saccharibacillus sp. CPCC 101409]|uniref:AraC family transcriptional regulator n=1 Tax=Saccharibacillus sp. CPCC 101409 TaxID=3058041 RepID=UPI00267335AD|nr:AraC family transcriptional regulator [Saccharibacillus sp. CPCC 101409]MDO3410981.1 AraC family transcriptional regulator [Saccharibacillus sp. CPCC 101409]